MCVQARPCLIRLVAWHWGALDAMTYGLRYVGVELEPCFAGTGTGESGIVGAEVWLQGKHAVAGR